MRFNYDNFQLADCNFDLQNRYQIIFDITKTSNIGDLNNFLSKLKKEANLENDFKKLGIDLEKDYENIISGVNILRLSNNPIKLEKQNLKKKLFFHEKKKLNKGILFWITGLSGVGKTSIANKIKNQIENKYGPTLVINGDDLREIFKLESYSQSKRLEYGKIYCNFLKFLTDQNINIIFTVVGMFSSLRKWNRQNIKNYVEIFIRSDIKIIKKKQKKNLQEFKKKYSWIGYFSQYPEKPDILIENNFTKSINYLSKQIIKKSKLKILILIGGGRSGIDLLQSLFDQHTQVSQFPGVFKWNEFYKSIKDQKSPKLIASVFTKKYRMF